MTMRKKPELLVPASSLEVLKCAVRYGADAVYIGGEAFGLRAKAKNFSPEEMAEGIAYAHDHGVRVHVTANILAHNYDLEGAAAYFAQLRDMTYQGRPAHPDALIVADPGMFSLVKEIWPEAEIHVSTQANNTNYATYNFWWKMGAKRVVSARELSLREIAEIREHIPEEMEIESFVHGAMCISYSGRCLLSNYFTGRDANHGACTHPCRWKFAAYESNDPFLTAEGEPRFYVEEDSRKGQFLPVYENERGTYIFNSKDLCMIEYVPELIEAGIDSWKIEGRMKTALYVAAVARTYRRAIDDYFESPDKYRKNLPWYREQIAKCTYRQFSTGFFFGKPSEENQIYDSNTYSSDAIYLGMVERVLEGTLPGMSENVTLALLHQKNKFLVGDTFEIMKPDGREVPVIVKGMFHLFTPEDTQSGSLDASKAIATAWGPVCSVESCPHSGEAVWVWLSEVPEPGDLLRK